MGKRLFPHKDGPRILFLTGAGLSADSGVPTFRDPDGHYASGRASEEIMSSRFFKTNPGTVHSFCDDRRAALADAEPNAAHRAIARLEERYGARVLHATQNIDDLCERAGSVATVHVHGFLTSMRSVGNSSVHRDIGYKRYWSGGEGEAPEEGFKFRCPKSNSLFRPDVVLFGELAPEYAKLYKALGELRRDDLLVVIGTQGSVLPAASFAAKAPCRSLLVNLHESDDLPEEAFTRVIMGRASEAAAEIENIADDVMAGKWRLLGDSNPCPQS